MGRYKLADEDALRRLGSDEATGLTEEEAARRLKRHGPNLVVHHLQVDCKFRAMLKCILLLWGWDHSFTEYIKYEVGWESWEQLISPLSRKMVCVMITNVLAWTAMVASTVSLAINSAGQTSYELAIIVSLLAGSLSVCCITKLLADHAKEPLDARAFSLRANVLRDGIWKDEHAGNLVPGDIIYVKCGDIVPADARVLNLARISTKILHYKRCVDCVNGPLIYYGWAVSCGKGTAVVTATGNGIPRSTLNLYPKRFARPGQLRKGVMAAGSFCFCLVLVGIIPEALFGFFFVQNLGAHFMPLVGVTPMVMPALLYLVLVLGSRKLSKLGIASRGTFALEDLASMDAILFNMTGTLTCNKPCFDKDKIQVYAQGIDTDSAILLAAQASLAYDELCKEPIDTAILDLIDDPEQVTVGIKVIKRRSHIFVAMTLMHMTTYIDENGAECSVLKGDPASFLRECNCSDEFKERIIAHIDELGLDGYKSISVGRIVNSRLDIIALLPFIDELKNDSSDAVDNLTDMGLSVVVLTEHNPSVISDLRTKFGRRCAMVGYEFLDGDTIRESNIGISVADATDRTKSESDLILTEDAMISISSAVQISRDICRIMKGCMVYAVSSTLHAFAIRLISLMWRLELSCFLALVIAACNYCTSTAMLFERVKPSKSPDSLKLQKIIATGAALGGYVTLSTVIFVITAARTDFVAQILKARPLIGHDDEIRSAMFLQIIMVNHATGLFAHSYNGYSTDCPGPVVTVSFVVSQLEPSRRNDAATTRPPPILPVERPPPVRRGAAPLAPAPPAPCLSLLARAAPPSGPPAPAVGGSSQHSSPAAASGATRAARPRHRRPSPAARRRPVLICSAPRRPGLICSRWLPNPNLPSARNKT